jgi:peroxiredoxin
MKNWYQYALVAAGIYNILFGCVAVFAPSAVWQWSGIPAPLYPELWQCIGMIVGVYGIGYLIAATDPLRHWPIVFVGFLGKVLGPIGFLNAALAGRLPWKFGWINVFNDLIWLVPFALILKMAHDATLGRKRVMSREVVRMALGARTQHGVTINEMSRLWPTLVVFLRHAGCTFCREALADLAKQRAAIESTGTRIVLVHMGTEEDSAPLFRKYGLEDISRVSDPQQSVYRAFGLTRGSVGQLFGPVVWARGFRAGILDGHGIGRLVGDGFQMPGVFLVFHSEIVRSYRHQSASDRPDYREMAAPVERPELA